MMVHFTARNAIMPVFMIPYCSMQQVKELKNSKETRNHMMFMENTTEIIIVKPMRLAGLIRIELIIEEYVSALMSFEYNDCCWNYAYNSMV